VTAVVVAAVRPSRPNHAVIRAAAELARACVADLLIVSTIRFYVADWSDVPYTENAVLDSYERTLFDRCAQVLGDDPVDWSVHVSSQSVSSTVNDLVSRRRVVGLVVGSQRHGGWLIQLRRRLVGSPTGRVRGVHKLVIDDVLPSIGS
jgi:K+-sensing histidine kinase KdpD